MKKIKIKNIRTDGGTQTRAELNQDIINQYADLMLEEIEFPAVTIFYDGTEYWLADGFHRLRASEKAGFIEIESDIKQGTQRDAILYSVGANNTHGLRRTNADKRRAVMVLLEDKEWKKWSDRKIAEKCGVSNKFVSLLRPDTVNNTQYEKIFIHPKTGKETTMNTANIGKTQGIKKQTQPDIVPDENTQEEEKKPDEEKESFIPTGKPAENPNIIDIDFVDELTNEMYDTILRRFRKLNKTDYNRAIKNLINLLKGEKRNE